ncbi:hypothetical protein NP493_914g00018 [Ridgeia piscesae]|uniref:Concentrative nucleoside transporter C-terminal domain-containing protein n=1 Tax=Ridgeia piscesae TaxID=27915 RepID=A0AAD9KLP7_RIDPI|nr:hypothetical protein NP493_914g00018 [Ridgeia piscesae]
MSLQERSEVIATYAMCGFASLTAIGVAMGVLRTIAPNRTKDASAISMRAMIAGNGANFLTACVAGRKCDVASAAVSCICHVTILREYARDVDVGQCKEPLSWQPALTLWSMTSCDMLLV